MEDKNKKIDRENLIKQELEKNPPAPKKKPNWFRRKGRKIKKIMGDFWMVGKTGFMMGGFVGLVMGFLGGCLTAYKTKTLLYIPIGMISSGIFFASLMSVGACLRTETIIYDENNNPVAYMAVYKSEKGDDVFVNYKFKDSFNSNLSKKTNSLI
eukprot:CAMPEP_0170515046 /NCGR_PEP_ID=MMETSP0209-20121228/1537_1 /TAXON_ID=665100 ORGANISM="Litonotus pictus, Strain P1" /NCGR_SAMPLE_ID=MMETSP0209 /ASSEMBLY_ACC=CAM_ASM_000301 /LENGTH=153 /DNA_ID=CAMNT_0010799363 /DNA_START=6 /DNA_END=467 /DNA_ORIENTATION=+